MLTPSGKSYQIQHALQDFVHAAYFFRALLKMASFFAQHYQRHRCTTYKKKDPCEGDSGCIWVGHPRNTRFKHKLKKFFDPSLDVDVEGRCQSKRPSNAASMTDRNLLSEDDKNRSHPSLTTSIHETPFSKSYSEALTSSLNPEVTGGSSPQSSVGLDRAREDSEKSETDLESTSPSSKTSIGDDHHPSGHYESRRELSVGDPSATPTSSSYERHIERPPESPTVSFKVPNKPFQSSVSEKGRGNLVKERGGFWEKQIARHGVATPQNISAEADVRHRQAAKKQEKLELEKLHAEQKKREYTERANDFEDAEFLGDSQKEFHNLSISERRKLHEEKIRSGGAQRPK